MSIKQTRYVDIASAVIARAVTKTINNGTILAGKTLTDVQKITVQTLLVMI